LTGWLLGTPPPAAKIPLLDDSASDDPFGSSRSPSSAADDPFGSSRSPSSAADDPFGSSPGAAFGSSSPAAGSDAYDPFSGLDSSFTSTFGSADPFNTNPGGVRVVPQAKLLTGASWDLSGGFLTGMLGGNLKATSPVAFSTALLAWGLSSFGEAYDEAGVRQQLLDNVRWGSDYLMKVHQTAGKQELIVTRVGDVESEVQLWYRPEDSSAARPAYAVDMVEGASDLGGSVAAALAASSVVFRAAEDAAYASALLTKAEQIYQIAKTNLGFYSVQDFNASLLYNSTTYYDDLAWAAAWLYKATAQSNYLSDLYDLYVRHLHYEDEYDASYVFDWDHVFWPTNVLMAQESGVATFVSQSQTYLQHWLCANQAANYTLRGRAYNPASPSTGATLNTAMTALMFADVVSHTDDVAAKAYRCWALGQIRYVLGDSGRSLTVGVGKQPPERTQDRNAACPTRPQTCNRVTGLLSPDPDTYVLEGALVYGPSDSDYFVDDRKDESNQ
ncbi:glycosyl hydrolase, partial [Helicosporidium sp. ATCC 50920]